MFFFNDPATPEIDTYGQTVPDTTLFRSGWLVRPDQAVGAHRQVGGDRRLRPGRPGGGPAADAGRSRRDRVRAGRSHRRSEEHTSELQSLMRRSSAAFGLKK